MAEGEGIEPPRRYRRHLSKVLHYRSANLPENSKYYTCLKISLYVLSINGLEIHQRSYKHFRNALEY